MIWATIAFAIFAGSQAPAQDSEPDSSSTQPNPLSFPREVTGELGTVVIHTPQIDTWNDFASVAVRLAVEVTPKGEAEPVYGVVMATADTDPNIELRVVAVENVQITATNFPNSDDARRDQLDDIVRATVQQVTQFLPLDVILTYIEPEAGMAEDPGLNYEPPPIFYSSTPAVLVMTDGEPLLAPVPDTKLQYAVNTNWDLFRYNEKEWYLRDDDRWLKNKTLSGDWKFDNSLPSHFKKLPDDGNWTDVKAAIPPTERDEDEPIVFVSDRPAELIMTEGKLYRRTIGGAGLEYVANTESDLFIYEQKFYYLVSGRWFSAAVLRGPWDYVKELPSVFASIPANHEKAYVLAAVPGTDEARLAALEALLPRKATVSRNAGENISVFYQGDEPQFELIPGTDVERAINSPNDILKVDNTYYLCESAVWYVSMHADGPWVVADEIPAAIYSISPSSASYHVTHVHVYESDSDSVSTGYTSGYFGVNVSYGVAMYGSGWYYPSYYGYNPYYGYPYYYPYPYSYGASAWYNPNTGMYGRSGSVYGPYGGYGRAASYNPQTGTYARGSAVWDSDEIAGSAVAYNPRTGTGVATNRYANENGRWGESLISHNDKWLETQSQWDGDSRSTQFRTSEGGTGQIERQKYGDGVVGAGEFERGDQTLSTVSARGEQGGVVRYETGSGETGAIGRSSDGDLYAGKDGEVYKRDEDGWHKHNDGGWDSVEVPDERAAQIDQQRSAAAESRETNSQTRMSDTRSSNRPTTSQGQPSLSQGGYAGNYGAAGGRSSGSFDSSLNHDLNRSHQARTSGYENYNNRRRSASGTGQMGTRGSGRRRR